MTYNQMAETAIEAEEIAKRNKEELRQLFLQYFGKDGKFEYNELYKESAKYDAENFCIDEMPGWSFNCANAEEGGGHYLYTVLCYAPGVEGVKFQSKATLVVEIGWD